jgi:hypothetical protein
MITAAGQGPAPPGSVSVASRVTGPLVKCITESRIGPPWAEAAPVVKSIMAATAFAFMSASP